MLLNEGLLNGDWPKLGLNPVNSVRCEMRIEGTQKVTHGCVKE